MAKLEILNDSMNSPLRLVLEDGTIYGQMYNSWDKKYHLAEYIPYKKPPTKYACGITGNMSPSRETHERNICQACFCRVLYTIPYHSLILQAKPDLVLNVGDMFHAPRR